MNRIESTFDGRIALFEYFIKMVVKKDTKFSVSCTHNQNTPRFARHRTPYITTPHHAMQQTYLIDVLLQGRFVSRVKENRGFVIVVFRGGIFVVWFVFAAFVVSIAVIGTIPFLVGRGSSPGNKVVERLLEDPTRHVGNGHATVTVTTSRIGIGNNKVVVIVGVLILVFDDKTSPNVVVVPRRVTGRRRSQDQQADNTDHCREAANPLPPAAGRQCRQRSPFRDCYDGIRNRLLFPMCCMD